MSVKILFIGDPHIQISNLQEVELFMEKIINLATEKQPDIIVIAGDLLHDHERIHTTALNKAYELVNNMRLISKTYILVGNHDYMSNQQFLTEHHWMNGMKEWDNVKIIDTVYTRNHGDHKFVFCPYVPVGRFEEALKNVSWKDASCIFAHQEFKGCKMGAIISEDGDAWNTNLPFIVSGHIHSNQLLPIGVYYPGSAMQHAFGESDHNIIPILNFKNDTHVYKEIDLGLSRKKIIYIDSNELEDFKIPTTDDEIRLTVSGTVEQFKSFKKSKKYKKMISNGIKIVYKSKKKKIITTDTQETDFFKILKKLIDDEKNSELKSDWKNISQ
jgi:DNA repair exonuclease SbcCD nuclease subunit